MRLRAFYNHFLNELKPLYEYEEAAAVSSMIFEHFAGKNRTDIITDPGHELENEKTAALENALLQLKRSIPVQYVIGHAWFMDRQFKVSPAVLIPRPETAELVSEAIQFIQANNKRTVLDIGSGSGCIAISIKATCKNAEVSAMDISEKALMIAKENAAANGTSIHFIQQDFLQEKDRKELPQFDVLISNPPYIPENEKELLDQHVTAHEPHLALFVPDNDALVFYDAIARFAQSNLSNNGCVFVEIHEDLGQKTKELFESKGFYAEIKKDFQGKDRMVKAVPAIEILGS